MLDVSTRGKIRGVEILNATSFLKEFNVGRKILENLSDAPFDAQIKPSRIIMSLVLKSDKVEYAAKIAVPLEVPAGA